MSTTRQHQLWAVLALLAAAMAGWWLSAPADLDTAVLRVSGPSASKPSPAAAEGGSSAPASTASGQRTSPWPQPDAAALRAWASDGSATPAPAAKLAKPAAVSAAAPAAASAPPRAPTPAWRFVGRIHDGTAVRAMLLTAQQLRVVAEKEALDAEWRVERISEQGVELVWLPGDQRVRLAWASS